MSAGDKQWRREVITPEVEGVLASLVSKSLLGRFYLAGGTGLALHLGHRRSVDLDFFSAESVDEDSLLHKAQQLAGFSLLARSPGTLHAHVQGVRVSFFSYPYPLLFPADSFLDAAIADPRDIACMKISALASRGARRDFVDLYAASQRYGLPELLEWFRRKFAQANYSQVHVLKSLTFFDDAEKDPPPDLLVPLSWEQVRSFFAREAPRLL